MTKETNNLTKIKLGGGLVSTVLGLITLTTLLTPIPQVTEHNLEVSRLNARADFTIAPAPYSSYLTNTVAYPLIILGLVGLVSGAVDISKQFNNESIKGDKGGNEQTPKKQQFINNYADHNSQTLDKSIHIADNTVPTNTVPTFSQSVYSPNDDNEAFAREEDPLDFMLGGFESPDSNSLINELEEESDEDLDNLGELITPVVFSAPERLRVNKENEKGFIDKKAELVGLNILNSLYGSRKSTLVIGGTGAGKSVTVSYMLSKLFETYPDVEAYVISQKNDSFCGLNALGRVTIFDYENLQETIDTINSVYEFYRERKMKVPENKRAGLPPVRLFLADWLSINGTLEDLASDPVIKESKYLIKLRDLIYNGRDYNVSLVADLQSFNLKAIGINTDQNGRDNFNLIGLGNYYTDSSGQVNESYGVVDKMLRSPHILSDNNKADLIKEFNRLKNISRPNQRPIIFTKMDPARVGLLPDLRAYKEDNSMVSVPDSQVELNTYFNNSHLNQADTLINNENLVQFPIAH